MNGETGPRTVFPDVHLNCVVEGCPRASNQLVIHKDQEREMKRPRRVARGLENKAALSRQPGYINVGRTRKAVWT